jgi:hypothetical protein
MTNSEPHAETTATMENPTNANVTDVSRAIMFGCVRARVPESGPKVSSIAISALVGVKADEFEDRTIAAQKQSPTSLHI